MTEMLTRVTTRVHTYPPCAIADAIRASIPRITCRVCGLTVTRSNPTNDLCDACHDASPLAVFNASHGVAWHANTEGVPN